MMVSADQSLDNAPMSGGVLCAGAHHPGCLACARTSDNIDTMVVTFTTKTHADITMFGDIALTLLEKMGHSTNVPGAILAADVPEALAQLKAAMDLEKALPPTNDTDEEEPAVSLAHQALPLIDLLTAAVKADADVMWK